jgi:hypothetical protein
MRKVTIAIASPSDVQEERDRVLRVFNRWNEANDDAFLHSAMWESFAVPELGDHPQHILNRSIVSAELLVAIFWAKLGSPTPTAASGSAEEIREFIAAKGAARVMVYFCTRDLPYTVDPGELTRLLAFKSEMRSQGIYHEYRAVDEFDSALYRHLDVKIKQLLGGALPPLGRSASTTGSVKSAGTRETRVVKPLIEVGSSFDEICETFANRMKRFNEIDGCTSEKYLALGSNVYDSVAAALDRYCTYRAYNLAREHKAVISEISSELKRLASEQREYVHKFNQFWEEGEKLSSHLIAHRDFLKRTNAVY